MNAPAAPGAERRSAAAEPGGGASQRAREIGERLADVLQAPLTESLTRLSSGASRETFAFATEAHGGLVLQIERGSKKLAPVPPQAPLLQAAAEAGVPVPRVVAHGGEDAVLGPSWIVVEALAGTSDPRAILAGEGVPAAEELIDGIAAALAAVHRMPADPALAPPIDDPLALLQGMHESLGEVHPTFDLAFRALQEGRPAAAPRTLVHGDFRMGNLMVGPQGLSGVLDWELTHLGDPIEDLGWVCVPAWRFSRPDRPAAGLGTREQLLAAYAWHGGIEVEPAALRWWELAGTLRWGLICVMQAFVHLGGSARSVEHAVIGRRACEVEWDLLEMLDPERGALAAAEPRAADTPTEGSALHDRPTAVELLDAARGALGDDVLPHVEGRAAFQLRVSLRAIGMVERELVHAAEHEAARADALASLGVQDEAELARSIRDGSLDGRGSDVLAALRVLVRAKLEVANPAYLRAASSQA